MILNLPVPSALEMALVWLLNFIVHLFRLSWQMPEGYLKLGSHRFIPYTFQFTILGHKIVRR
jgi:hypothetical protein